MKRLVLTAGILAAAVLLAACKGDSDQPAAMPAGYERIDAAFGFRPAGATYANGQAQAPAVEFRANGDYALYPFAADCNGHFSRGAGMVFAADGTVREQSAAQDKSDLSANPQYQPLADRLCTAAKENRFVPDPFDLKQALVLLHGEVDANGEATLITKVEGEPAALRVSVRTSGEFTENGAKKRYLITGSRNSECEAHACGGGIVGAATFELKAGKWQLQSQQADLLTTGQYGAAPAAAQIGNLRSGLDTPILRIDSDCFGNGGYCSTPVNLIAYVSGGFAVVWGGTSSDDTSYSPECENNGHCTDWKSELALKSTGNAGWPELVVARKGKEWNADTSELLAIDETVTYRFDGKNKFVEVSRAGKPVVMPTPVPPAQQAVIDAAEAAQDAADAQAAAINERSDWINRCIPQVRTVTTAAGSQVGLNVQEATQLCTCVHSASPQSDAAMVAARNQCLDQLL